MTSYAEPFLCVWCRRFRSTESPRPTCTAYPGGIPVEITANRADHRKPYPGDGGRRFDPRDTGDADAEQTMNQLLPGQGTETAPRLRPRPKDQSPLGIPGGGMLLNEEAHRYAEAVQKWRASGYDDQIMIDAGFWADPEDS